MCAAHEERERQAVGAAAVLREWLAAVEGRHLTEAALAAWARREPEAFAAAFARFARVPPDLAFAAAAWLLGPGVRPDDRVLWRGKPDPHALAALAALGGRLAANAAEATLVVAALPPWPPAAV